MTKISGQGNGSDSANEVQVQLETDDEQQQSYSYFCKEFYLIMAGNEKQSGGAHQYSHRDERDDQWLPKPDSNCSDESS